MPVSRKSLLRALLVLFLAVVVTAMVVPFSVVETALKDFGWLGKTLDFLDTVAPGLEASHLVSFGALGFLARFCWPRRRFRTLALGVLVVAVLVESAQIFVPGRQAALSHALLETLGGWAGLGVAWLLTFAWGEESLPEYKHSTHWRGDNSDH
jgi:hypothetical protein